MALEVTPGGFFYAQAVMGSLRKEFRQSALEVLNIVDAEQSKNCGRRPTEEVQTKCPAADSIIFNTYKKHMPIAASYPTPGMPTLGFEPVTISWGGPYN